jgi:hypothetical protein
MVTGKPSQMGKNRTTGVPARTSPTSSGRQYSGLRGPLSVERESVRPEGYCVFPRCPGGQPGRKYCQMHIDVLTQGSQ